MGRGIDGCGDGGRGQGLWGGGRVICGVVELKAMKGCHFPASCP